MSTSLVSNITPLKVPVPASPHEAEVTLLFSDIVGSTEMTVRLGDREAHRVIHRHHRLVRRELVRHAGREIELRGDGFYVAFPTPEAGLLCALAIQRSLALDAHRHPEQPIRVRMGLHTGLVLRDGHAYFGRTVIEAARIADHASGGEILVSARLRARVFGRFAFARARDVELRGLEGRHQIFSVIPGRTAERVSRVSHREWSPTRRETMSVSHDDGTRPSLSGLRALHLAVFVLALAGLIAFGSKILARTPPVPEATTAALGHGGEEAVSDCAPGYCPLPMALFR